MTFQRLLRFSPCILNLQSLFSDLCIHSECDTFITELTIRFLKRVKHGTGNTCIYQFCMFYSLNFLRNFPVLFLNVLLDLLTLHSAPKIITLPISNCMLYACVQCNNVGYGLVVCCRYSAFSHTHACRSKYSSAFQIILSHVVCCYWLFSAETQKRTM